MVDALNRLFDNLQIAGTKFVDCKSVRQFRQKTHGQTANQLQRHTCMYTLQVNRK